jgi:ubiquinol-cytochrome c reductase cytochrome b subunit
MSRRPPSTFGLPRWIDDRLRGAHFVRSVLNKVFPDHWSFMLGEIALYCFVVLVLTGTFLAFFFTPSAGEVVYRGAYAPLRGVEMSQAYASVLRLSFEVRAGLVMRQIHHWAALLFVGAIVTHMARIFFTGAFRRPRELNWLIGVTLLLLAMFNGFTGYSLPDDLLSGTGLRIAHSVALSVPLIGTWITSLIFGGEFPAPDLIPRLFVAHIFIVPLLLFGLIAAHVAILWRQKHTDFPGKGRTETNVVGSRFYPTYATKSIGLFFGIFAVLGAMGGLLQINAVWLYGPFDPAFVSAPAQPDWYLGWLEGALRLMPPWELELFGFVIPNVFFPGVLLLGVTFTFIYLWPWIERRFITRDDREHHILDRPRDNPLRTGIGAGVLTFYAVLFLAGSNDVIADTLTVPVSTVTAVMQGMVLGLPVVVGWLAHRAATALKRTETDGFLQVPLWALARPSRASGDGRKRGLRGKVER